MGRGRRAITISASEHVQAWDSTNEDVDEGSAWECADEAEGRRDKDKGGRYKDDW